MVKINNKYQTKYSLIINIDYKEGYTNFDVYFFSLINNNLKKIDNFNESLNTSNKSKILESIDKWWKKKNLINNSITSEKICYIKNSNLNELVFIKSSINSLSQVKSSKLLSISLGLNSYKLIFYGNLNNFVNKLLNFKIYLYNDKNNQCIISTSEPA